MKLSKLSMSSNGQLKFRFSKPIMPLPFVQTNEESQNSSTQQRILSKPIALEDAIEIRIDDDELILDKSIANMQIVSIEEKSFTV